MTSRKKSGLAFWATVVVVVGLVLYPLSFGPACWITSRTDFGWRAVPTLYYPLCTFRQITYLYDECREAFEQGVDFS